MPHRNKRTAEPSPRPIPASVRDLARWTPQRASLVLHTAVDYARKSYCGIGIILTVACADTGLRMSKMTKIQQAKHQVRKGHLGEARVTTKERAYLLAISKSVDLARKVLERGEQRLVDMTRKVEIHAGCAEAVARALLHLKGGRKSTATLRHAGDRFLLRDLIRKVQWLSSKVKVTILKTVVDMKAAEKARRIARQRGRKSYMGVRKAKQARKQAGAEEVLHNDEAESHEEPQHVDVADTSGMSNKPDANIKPLCIRARDIPSSASLRIGLDYTQYPATSLERKPNDA